MGTPLFFKDIFNNKISLLLVVALAAGMGTACKKKSQGRGSPAPAAPVDGFDAQGAGDECAVSLSSLKPLSATVPGSLNLTSADLENVKIGSFSTAKLTFALKEGSAVPDKYIYYACSTSKSKECILGSTAIGQDFNPDLPEGAINLKAWACVGPERIKGYPASLANYGSSKITVKGSDFYCGSPVVHYDKMDSNFGQETLGQIQSLIKSLEVKREELAYKVVKIVQKHVHTNGAGLNLTSGEGSKQNEAWVSIANGNYKSAAGISMLYGDALAATDDGIERSRGKKMALALTANTENPCLPVPDLSTVNPTPAPFTPPVVKTPEVPKATVTPDVAETKTAEATDDKSKEETKPTETVAVKSGEEACKTRGEWFSSQEDLGTTEWVNGRCFHVNATTGSKTVIDVSIDPEALQPPVQEEEEIVDEDTGMSGWQKTGIAMMAIGGTLGVAGGLGHAYSDQIGDYVSSKNQESMLTKVQDERMLVGVGEFQTEGLQTRKSTMVQPDELETDTPRGTKQSIVELEEDGFLKRLKQGDAETIGKTGRYALMVGVAMFALGGILGSGVLELSGSQTGSDLSDSITSDPGYKKSVKDIEEINRIIGDLQRQTRGIVAEGESN